jgi:hypothetical protein
MGQARTFGLWGRDPEVGPPGRRPGRSAFIRSAIGRYLRRRKRLEVDQATASTLARDADVMLAEVDTLMDAQAWPDPRK